MKICVVSGYTRSFESLAAITAPVQQYFATQLGFEYQLFSLDFLTSWGIPASWGKIPVMIRLLQEYDMLIWIDTDAIPTALGLTEQSLNDYSAEIIKFMRDCGKGQALVCQPNHIGLVPNYGIWWAKKSWVENMILCLMNTSRIAKGFNALWWEQTSFLNMMGFKGVDKRNAIARLGNPTYLFYQTYWLPQHFNGRAVSPPYDESKNPISKDELSMFPEGHLVQLGGELRGERAPYLYHHCGVPYRERIAAMQQHRAVVEAAGHAISR